MSTKLTYTGAEVQELLDKIEKGDFDNAKTLEGHPASYFAIASEFTSLAESFTTEQGRINTLYRYFNNGSANNALRLGGQLPSYYATTTQYEILQQALSDFKSLFDSMFEKDSDGNIHAKLPLWSSGGITAGGGGSGGSGGGGGISYNRLDLWSDYSADKSGWVLSALLGKDLDNRVSALSNAGYVTQAALAPYALSSSLNNYLPKSGGTIYGTLAIDIDPAVIRFSTRSQVLGYIGFVADSTPIIFNSGGNTSYTLIHSGNISSQSVAYATNADNANKVGNYGIANLMTFIVDESGSYVAARFTDNSVSQTASEKYIEFWRGDWYNAKWGKVTAVNGFIGNLTGTASGNLPLTGGTLNGNLDFNANSTNSTTIRYLRMWYSSGGSVYRGMMRVNDTNLALSHYSPTSEVMYELQIGKDGLNFNDVGVVRKILHSGNYTDYTVPKTGGTFSGDVKANSVILDSLNFNVGSGNRKFSIEKNGAIIFTTPSGGWTTSYRVNSSGGTQLNTIIGAYGVNDEYKYTYIGGTYSTPQIVILNDGKTGIGTASPTEKLHVNGNGKFTGTLTSPAITTNSLTIGGATITYDSVNEALCVNGNMYALGGVTAGGAGISAYTSLEVRVARLEQQLNIS